MTRWAWLGVASVAAGWQGPLLFVLWWVGRSLRHRKRDPGAPSERDVDDLAALLVIGLSASLTLAGALEASARQLTGSIETEIHDLLRRAHVRGLASALAETEGPLAALASQLARAQLTGAPMVDAVAAFLQTRRGVVRAALMESARTLPVRLVVPVTLLLLPGFVVLLMGPFVVDQISHLIATGPP